MENVRVLRSGIEATDRFNILSKEVGVPLVAFTLKETNKMTVFEIAENLRRFGWIIPAYTMPADAQHIAVLRVVVREDFNRSLAIRLVTDLEKVIKELETRNHRFSVIAAGSTDDGKPKKTAEQIQEEVTRYWKKFVHGRKTGIC